jgi:DNA modification methylase
MIELNKVYCMDNITLLKQLPDNYIDLIYCDILYGTGRNFGDYQDLKCDRKIIEEHYIPRIKEMYRVLKDTGSIYLQMDTRINHWIRCLMDDIFGYDNFRNEIVWCYINAGNNCKRYFNKKYDIILYYSKTKNYVFNIQFRPYAEGTYKNYLPGLTGSRGNYSEKGVSLSDWWTDISVGTKYPKGSDNNIGYFSQKPKALLERIIKASSNENDIVADFYLGSGTSMAVAKELNRQFIGCDISQKAVDITNQRLADVVATEKRRLF